MVFDMDPATIGLILSALSAGTGILGSLTGDKAKSGSTFNKNQLKVLDEILDSVRGQKGNQDITNQQGYQQGNQWLQNLFNDPNFFNTFEAPLQRQFQEQ